tara:strand:+ start:2164 stop:9489 length:7326 start_codon:yes stop_codon:yes gene_type:complete
MPEIKHTFTAGKMNKDLDLRLVRNGEYRDAKNIQVRTTDADSSGDGSAGTAQNLKGNKELGGAYVTTGYDGNSTKIIGSVADEKSNKSYFFAAAPLPSDGNGIADKNTISAESINTSDLDNKLKFWVDSIIEVDADTETVQPIFVDVFGITGLGSEILSSEPGDSNNPSVIFLTDQSSSAASVTAFTSNTYTSFNVKNDVKDQIKVGMRVRFTLVSTSGVIQNMTNGEFNVDVSIPSNENLDLSSDFETSNEVISINGNTVFIDQSGQQLNMSELSGTFIIHFFDPERVLNFNYNSKNISSSINIIDDLLFWSDGVDEPKKINIKRCLAGTDTETYLTSPKHTKLMVKKADGSLGKISSVENLDTPNNPNNFIGVKKEHITVIRKKPTTPPILEMKRTNRSGQLVVNVDYPNTNSSGNLIGGFVSYYTNPQDIDEDGVVNIVETETDSPSSADQTYLIQPGDEVATGGSERYIRLPSDIDIRENDILRFSSTSFNLSPVIIDAQVIQGPIFYEASTDTNGYIIKCVFVDSRLSLLQPTNWDVEVLLSKPLFETKFGRFAYRYKYEDGECSAFSPWSELAFLPGDFLYSPKNGFNSGMENNVRELVVRGFIPSNSVRPHDVRTVDVLFKTTDDANVYVVKSITREIDDEWENFVDAFDGSGNELEVVEDFGKLTITSEMINRVLESNQLLRSWDNVPRSAKAQSVTGSRLVYGNYVQGYDINNNVGLKQLIISNPVAFPTPEKSVKSMRTYKWGMVFGDKYGRETPVLPSTFKTDSGEVITGDAAVEKSLSYFKNNFQLQQDWSSQPEDWMDYVKYYVKEISTEYYNLVMDRYFDSGDDGVWISFNSADRNKVDEETYLILKNEHGSQTPVLEPARYKILAIENEAPEFIKRRKEPIGSVIIDSSNIYGTDDVSDAVPTLLSNQNEINTENEFSFTKDDFKGTAIVKIKGTFVNNNITPAVTFTAESPFRNIGNFTDGGIYITEVFSSEDVDMYNIINNQLIELGISADLPQSSVDGLGDGETASIVYSLEFFDEVPIEGPEFNGKFFVKIQRNETLDAKITSQSSGDYNIEQEFDIAYISNTLDNPASVGPKSTYTWGTNTVSGFTSGNIESLVDAPSTSNNTLRFNFNDEGDTLVLNANNTQGVNKFGPGDPIATKTFWQNWFNTTTTQIFIDEAPAAMDYTFRITSDESVGTNLVNPFYSSRVLHYFGSDKPISHSLYRVNGSNDANGLEFNGVTGPQIFGRFESDVNLPINLGSATGNIQTTVLSEPFQPLATVTGEVSNGGFGNIGYSENFKPAGLSVGFAESGQFGQLTFSCVSNNISTTNGRGVNTTQRGKVTTTGGGGNGGAYGANQYQNNSSYNVSFDATTETYPTQFIPGTNEDFKNKMQTAGTLFRFPSDPSGTVYRVLTNEQEVNPFPALVGQASNADLEDNSDIFEGPLSIHRVSNFYDQTQTEESNINETASLRSSFIIRFARVGELNETIPGTGIDAEYFDPRGQVAHDGTETLKIQILSKAIQAGEDLFFETTAACWETEPKETTDLDIYYEASPAIPMTLKNNNIQSFVQSSINKDLASSFYAKPRVTEGNYEYIEMSSDAYVNKSFQDNIIQIKHNYSLPQSISSTTSPTSDNLVPTFNAGGSNTFKTINKNIVAIGDEVCFARPDGYQTKSVIVEHLQQVENAGPDSFKVSNNIGITPGSSGFSLEVTENKTILRCATTTAGGPNGLFLSQVTNFDAVTNVVDENFNTVATQDGVTFSDSDLSEIAPNSQTTQVKLGMHVYGNEGTVKLPKGTFVESTKYISAISIPGFTFTEPLVALAQDIEILEITLSKALISTNTGENLIAAFWGNTIGITFFFQEQTGFFRIDKNVWRYPVILNWFNCYSFGNGVESDRIRDDFNTPTIDNGCRVSSTFLEYGEENISSGLIHSGLYNSISSVNNLNEFNMAEKITKNINPSYGSIQALKSRNNNIVVFSEDKVLKVLANKDAVFNADGNPQLVATNRVLGDATPYAGDYGISNNPESLASDSYRLYFTDKQRGAVLRLSMDGLTPISDVNMRTYFRENLKLCDSLVGTFDGVNGEYNLSLNYKEEHQKQNLSVSFNEGSKGWVSFKSFVPSAGLTVAGKYITSPSQTTGSQDTISKMNKVYVHDDDTAGRNNFYGTSHDSSIEIVFNDLPSVVKSFKAINYEGTQAQVINMQTLADEGGLTYSDEYYNLDGQTGWYVDTFTTDMQVGQVNEFINKENKWFNRITSLKSNLTVADIKNDLGQIAVQGLGNPISSDSTGNILSSTEVNIVIGELPPLEIIFAQNNSQTVLLSQNTGLVSAPKKYTWIGPNGVVARIYIDPVLNNTEVDFIVDGTIPFNIGASGPYLQTDFYTEFNYFGNVNTNYTLFGEGLWTIKIEEFTNFDEADDPIDFSSRSITGQVFLTDGSGFSENFDSLTLYNG